MQLSADIAYRTIDLVYAESGFKAIVCDTSGIIIAAIDKERVGTVHSGACRILRDGLEEVMISQEEETQSRGLVRVGVNLPITIGSEVVGTYGIGGPISLVRSIARISIGLIREDLYRAEIHQQAAEKEQRLQTLFDNMTEGVALHDVILDDTGKAVNYRIIAVNNGYEKNVGLKQTDVCGKLAHEAYGTPEAPFLERFTNVALTGVADSMEVFFEPLNKHFLISIVPWGTRGFATIFFDVSERKRMEKELHLHSIELEATVEQRTQELFASNEELTAMNEEMTAMNEELKAMNETLEDTNRTLATEVDNRQKKEQEVLRREKQYQATTNLIKNSTVGIHDLLELILNEAINLVGAPGGYIGLLDESGKKSVMRYTAGANRAFQMTERPTDVGLLGEVCQSGELKHVEDYYIYPNRLDKKHLIENLRTVIMMPLKQVDQVKGVLVANWQNEVHPVTVEDLEVFQQFGILASIAMERVYASEKIEKQNLLLQKLADSTAALVNELDMEKVLQNILHQATSFMGMVDGFIAFFEADGEHATFKCGLGIYENQIDNTVFFGDKGIFAEILRTGKLVAVDDYDNWARRLDYSFHDKLSASIQAPLTVDGKTLGSIGFAAFGGPITLDREMLATLEKFATVASIAVKNAMAHRQTHHQAFHDGLTGLPNRDYLHKRMDEEMCRARKGESTGAVLFIDLDDLKTVNDHFGHTSGDSVIIAAGQDITRVVGEDAFVARVGGDEFIVILPGVADLRTIAQVADRLIGGIRREFAVRGQNIQMSSSVGVTLYPGDGDLAEEILKNADIAMYAAKAAGKNCWRFYEPEMTKDAYEKMVLTNSLRKALENGELFLHFQPLISMKRLSVVGFEALLRWNSPQHGSVPPCCFIPLAEQSGIILSIGEWVIGEACRFSRALSEMGRNQLYVAVNVSPRQLAAEGFVEIVQHCVQEAGIKPGQLEIEITENVFIESMEKSTRKLAELSSLGIQLSLDDFGTGFSSLTYLRNLPVRTLKIDKTFIDRIDEDQVQEGFIRSIIEMAHVLNLKVVAEGVETESQLAKLAEFGCDSVQGYLFSRPVSKEEAICLL